MCISKEEDRLLDSSSGPPTLTTCCHVSESEAQEVAMDGVDTVSSQQFAPAEERRGGGHGNGRGRRFTRHRHTLYYWSAE